jgi:hypothetical protein
MLRLEAEAVTVELDGRGTPDASLDERKRRYGAGTTGDRGSVQAGTRPFDAAQR